MMCEHCGRDHAPRTEARSPADHAAGPAQDAPRKIGGDAPPPAGHPHDGRSAAADPAA